MFFGRMTRVTSFVQLNRHSTLIGFCVSPNACQRTTLSSSLVDNSSNMVEQKRSYTASIWYSYCAVLIMGIDGTPVKMLAAWLVTSLGLGWMFNKEIPLIYSILSSPTKRVRSTKYLLHNRLESTIYSSKSRSHACHTDGMVRAGIGGTAFPCITSHEHCGEVITLGFLVTDFDKGDSFAWSTNAPVWALLGLPWARDQAIVQYF